MGAWGPAIFSDDLAEDIRHEYNVLLSFGKENDEVEEILMDYYAEIFGCRDPDESVFWYALALCEWKKGRLSERAKKNALYCLEHGNDLERWNFPGNEKNYKKRLQVLKDFKNTILSPMPEKKKVRKPTVHHCPWKAGSLLAYRIVSNEIISNDPCFNKYVLLRVIKIKRSPVSVILPTDFYDESMLVGLYGWIGNEIPDPGIVEKLEYIAIEEGDRRPEMPRDLSILNILSKDDRNEIVDALNSYFSKYVMTCIDLDWMPVRGKRGDITYLGCDEKYEVSIPEFFDTSITSYSMTNFLAFDARLANRMKAYLEQ